jgi:hypothetical protein
MLHSYAMLLRNLPEYLDSLSHNRDSGGTPNENAAASYTAPPLHVLFTSSGSWLVLRHGLGA